MPEPADEPPFICTECREGDHENCWHDDDPYGPDCECDNEAHGD